MSKYVVTGNTVTLDAVDISASLARAELTMSSAEIDATDLASDGWTEVLGGLKSGSVTLDFHADFGASGISTTLTEALLGTIVTITIIANNGSTVGTTTPLFTFDALLTTITPVSGAVGDLSTFSLTLPINGHVVRTTS
tara:strand:- start:137 stop:553 length:417 start_codon:yes stop_codon:yes gene_type:complete